MEYQKLGRKTRLLAYISTSVSPGVRISQTYSSDPSIVQVETVLLEKQSNSPNDVVYSVYLWTDTTSLPPVNVSWMSSDRLEYANARVHPPKNIELDATINIPLTTETMTVTTVASDTSKEESNSSNSALSSESITEPPTANAHYMKPGYFVWHITRPIFC